MGQPATLALNLKASDVTGQNTVRVPEVPRDATVSDLVRGLLFKMGLVREDAAGQPLAPSISLSRAIFSSVALSVSNSTAIME